MAPQGSDCWGKELLPLVQAGSTISPMLGGCHPSCALLPGPWGPLLPFLSTDISALCLSSERRHSGCCGHRRGKASNSSECTDPDGVERG